MGMGWRVVWVLLHLVFLGWVGALVGGGGVGLGKKRWVFVGGGNLGIVKGL